MDVLTDHYSVLGLTCEEGSKLSEKEITKAYKRKALQLHPDKRLGDRDKAHADIQRLNASHALLKDEKKRKLFHNSIKQQLKKEQRHSHYNPPKPQKTVDPEATRQEEEDRNWRKCKEEIASYIAEFAARNQAASWKGKVGSFTENSRSGTKAKEDSTTGHEISRAATSLGTGHESFEASVLDKLKRPGEKQKLSFRADP